MTEKADAHGKADSVQRAGTVEHLSRADRVARGKDARACGAAGIACGVRAG